MITGKEYLKKHIGETNIPEEHFENEIGEIMDWYADDYHQEQVKKLTLADVSQQREPLLAYHRYLTEELSLDLNELWVDEHLKANNCG
jgi:hypothetical protein